MLTWLHSFYRSPCQTTASACNTLPKTGQKYQDVFMAELRPTPPVVEKERWEGHVASPPPKPYEHLERAHTPSLHSPFADTHPLVVEGRDWNATGTYAPAIAVRQFSIPPPLPVAPPPVLPPAHPEYLRCNIEFKKSPAATLKGNRVAASVAFVELDGTVTGPVLPPTSPTYARGGGSLLPSSPGANALLMGSLADAAHDDDSSTSQARCWMGHKRNRMFLV